MDFEEGKSQLVKLVAWATEHVADLKRNEADTRLQLIDQLLFECLDWRREDCHAEEQFNGTYSDYSFLTPRKFLIEAKREGIYFELPLAFGKTICRIATIADDNPTIDAAIRQAMRYCQERSIPIGSICNGHQLIAFLASRPDGVPPMSGKCLVFHSLHGMLDSFRLLWDNLSRPAVLSYALHAILGEEGVQAPPEKLSARISGFPGFKNRNPFQTELKILGELFIEDVARAPQNEQAFLERCYSPSGALSQYASISKQILQARYSTLFEKELEGPALESATTRSGLSKSFTEDILAASLKRRAIVLLGDVGVGKSIFIRHLVRISAKEIFDNALALYIDFGKEPALAENLEGFVLNSCSAQLYKIHEIDIESDRFVRGVYHGDLLRFQKGIYGSLAQSNPAAYKERELAFLGEKIADRAAHLRACLTHISKGQKRQIVIFLDNIDQRPIDFQDRVFLIGQSFAETWPATVFISLRPDTFNSSRVKGSLAAYQPRVFTISPPRVDLVIKLRLKYVSDYLRDTGALSSLGPNLSVRSGSLLSYVDVLIESFERSHQLVEFIDNLSGGNTRRSLDFLMTFIGSGHVDAEKILSIAENQGFYTIPIHEFMRSIIYGDFERYDSSASPITNIFGISSPDGREHFVMPNVLAFVERSGSSGQQGFVEAGRVHEFCQALGFFPAQIDFSLKRAVEKKLLEQSPQFSEEPATAFRITTAGSYSYKELPRNFSYIDAMTVDTPIVDRETRARIRDVFSLNDRLARGDTFRKYLDIQHAALDAKPVLFDWPGISADLAAEMGRIMGRAQV